MVELEGRYCCFIDHFCSIRGHQILARVPDDFIRDAFNLTGLANIVPQFNDSLGILLSRSHYDGSMSSREAEHAKLLYGLIHARYIITVHGLGRMREKYLKASFGKCLRSSCARTGLLPVGADDTPGVTSVKFFCPACHDVYHPTAKAHTSIDGAFFGTTFPHLFLFQHPTLEAVATPIPYIPTMFGFRMYSQQSRHRAQAARRVLGGEAIAAVAAEMEFDSKEAALVPTLSKGRFELFTVEDPEPAVE